MNLSDIANKVNNLGNAWEQFKQVNDRRLNEIEKKGSSDPLTAAHLSKLNDSIDKIQTVLNRPVSGFETLNQENQEYKHAFCSYIRKGAEAEIAHLEQKNLSTPGDTEIGYSVTNKMSEEIDGLLTCNSPIRQLASVTEISTDALELIEDREDVASGWSLDSVGDLDKSQDTRFSKRTILVHEIFAQPKVTQKLIDDPRINVEMWLSKKLAEVFTRQENIAFINGDGKGKPRGILSYEAGNEWGKISRVKTAGKDLSSDDLIKLIFSIKDIYATGTSFLMSRDALQKIRMLKDNYGRYIWQPSEKGASSLFGVDIKVSADMPQATSGKTPIAFANFKYAYQIVDRSSVRVLRDPFTHKPYIKFYSTKRVGGDVVNFDAIKLMEMSS